MLVTEIWAQLHLSNEDCNRIRYFFMNEYKIKPKYIVKKMHLTLYHSRRPMFGLNFSTKSCQIKLSSKETRFMVMAPGGENPKNGLNPCDKKIGIRVQWQSKTMNDILSLRNEILKYETKRVLGRRLPSTNRRSAFGSKFFQPHIAILRSGSGIISDLSKVGLRFRETMGYLTFDKYSLEKIYKQK